MSYRQLSIQVVLYDV